MHFAGLKSVAESVENPELYYENNIGGTENLLSAMEDNDCRKIVFPHLQLFTDIHNTCL